MARTEWPAVARCCVFPFLFAAFLPGCTSSSPKSESVYLAPIDQDVDGCRPVAYVHAIPPFESPDGWKTVLKSQAAARGANIVLHEVPLGGTISGRAYDCRGRKAKRNDSSSVLRSPPSQQSDADETTGAVFQVHDRMMAKESMSRMRKIAIAVEEYAVAQNAYPNATTMDELIGLLVPRYADVLPTVDAWGTVLSYAVATDHEHYRLMSAGANRTFQIGFLVSPIGSWHPGPQMDFAAAIVFEDGVFVQWPDVRY
jgi:hypothetical protein